jgi:hypothetical protein
MTSSSLIPAERETAHGFADELARFRLNEGAATIVGRLDVIAGADLFLPVPTFTNEFWTAKQRAAHSLHEVSYRACFKPQLPRFFIERLTDPGDVVYDPFLGRGTTMIEAALLGREVLGCDINPLSRILCGPRLSPPTFEAVAAAIDEVDWSAAEETPEDLLAFYHRDTLRQISALRTHLIERERRAALTSADAWVQMVAVNRLTGHSPGFFSVYTMPPNQAVSAQAQVKINARLQQTPPPRDVPAIILRKTRSLLKDVTATARAQLSGVSRGARLLTGSSAATPAIASNSVALVVTSPPFLDVVDYKTDNWLRCWFSGIDVASVPVMQARGVEAWAAFIANTMRELRRVVKPGGHVAFEVGEVRSGTLRLEELVIPAGVAAGLEPLLVLINAQEFTKTANCWGVTNNTKGTNTNRVVVFKNG